MKQIWVTLFLDSKEQQQQKIAKKNKKKTLRTHLGNVSVKQEFSVDNILKYFSFLFQENRHSHLMQTGDSLHEFQILFSGENKKNIVNFSSAKFAQRVVKLKNYHMKHPNFMEKEGKNSIH